MADNLIKEFDNIKRKFSMFVPDMVQVTGTKIQMDAKRDVPRKTSVLHNAIKNYADNNRFTAVVQVNVEYAAFVEFGTGTMVDIPDGMEEYARQFQGQGIKEVNISPQPYLMPAFERHTENFIKALNKLIHEL